MCNLEIFHKFDFFPREQSIMKIAFISVLTSSNNLSRCKMLKLSLRIQEDGNLTEYESFIKPFPRLTKVEIAMLPFEDSVLRKAPPLCDITFTLVALLENAQTVFMDRFSERIFKKSFKEIGYPMGSATFVLDKIFKSLIKSTTSFTLNNALKFLKLEQPLSTNSEKCKAMEKVFYKLEELGNIPQVLSKPTNYPDIDRNETDLSRLPNQPGVYLFRDLDGEVIYVGKAKNISQRVRSHFTSKIKFEQELCSKTISIDFEETGSETIALLLESHYITQLKPGFNTQQKDILDPYIISSKLDSKGILRIQAIQKSYIDSENEFYYNRDSVLKKIKEVQQKFNLCKRFTGIERTAGTCSDTIFCKGICSGLETKEEYNIRIKNALKYIDQQRPSYVLRLKGRNASDFGFVLVKRGIYHGFGFIDAENQINSINDIESYSNHQAHTYFTSRIIDQFFKTHKRNVENIIYF